MFEGLANFLQGKGWASNAQLDDEKKKKQQQLVTPNTGGLTVGTAKTVAPLQMGQVQVPQLTLQKPQQLYQPPQETPKEPNFWETIGAGLQQAGGGVLDVLLKGGNTLSQLGTMANPFLNDQQKQVQQQKDIAAGDFLRNQLLSQKDVTGQSIVGTTDVEENARKINAGQADIGDYAKVFGKGLDVANTVTSVIPVGTGLKLGSELIGSGVKATAGNVLKASVPLLKESALLGTTATGADVLSGRGISPESLGINYGLPVAFGGAGAGIGAGFRAGRNALSRGVTSGSEAELRSQALTTAKNSLLQGADELERTAAKTPSSELGKIDDGISSEALATSKRDAIKQNADLMRQQADAIETSTPSVDTPQYNPNSPFTLQKATPEQLLARANNGDPEAAAAIQKQFDEAGQAINADTVAPTPDAPVSEVIDPSQPLDSPITAESRNLAQNATPPPVITRRADELTSYEGAPDRATVEEYMRRIANGDTLDPIVTMRDSQGNLGIEDGKHRFQAYQESGINDIPTIDRTPNPLDDIQSEGRQLIESANATLATEGKSVGDLVQKLARANETGIPAQLTKAEQTAFKQLNDAVNSAQETAMRSGLISPETGNISQYLPTGTADNVLPSQIGDIANQDFNYSKSRTNALSDDDLKAGGENAFLDYFMRGKGSEHLDDATIDAQNATRAEVIAREEMFNIPREGNKPDQLDITPETKVQMEEAAVDAAEARRAQINAERAQSIGDKKTFKEQAAIAQEKSLDSAAKNINALQQSVKQRAELIKNSNLNAQQKKAQYSALFDHLESVIAKKTYIQPMVTSNVLGQVPGRVADQASKAIASTTDNLTSLVSQAGARASFKKGTGRSLQTDGRTLRKVVKDTDAFKTFNQDRFETKLNKRAGLGNAWTRGVTRLTQAGSRRRAPIKDTVSYFAAKAQSEGITKADDISRYVTEAARTPEWDKVYGMFYSSRNRFSGVPSFLPDANGNLQMTQTPLDPLFNSIERGLQKAVDMIPGVAASPAIRKNLKTAIRQATLGFPRVIANQGYQAINTAALGVPDLLRAAATKGTDDISRLKKAVLIKQGLEGLQTAGGAYALGGAMGAAGLVSGAYPSDPAEQQQWQDEGKQEYSVNIGGVWVDPFRYAGLAGLPIMIGGLIGSGKGSDLGGLTVDIAGALGQNFGVGAIQDLTKFLSGDTPQGQSTSLAMNFAGQFVPGLSELNSLANATDPNQRDVKSQDWGQEFLNRGINKIPFLRQSLDKKTDSFGNEMKNPGYGISAVLPINGGDTGVNADPAQAEASRLQSAGFDVYPKGVDGSANNYTLKDGEDTAIKISDAQQKDLNNAIKEGKSKMAETLMASEAYQNASDEEKAKMLKSVYSTNSAGIASQWAKDNGIDNAKQDTKGIADSLDPDKASALAVADAMDTDTRDKWLEDKTNAVNYNVGKYENAIANGTLTAKDDNLENSSSLHYKAIASQVNATLPYWTATLEEQYKNTTKKELMAMSPDNPIRQALLALDAARTGAGVSLKDGDHSLSKYGTDGSGGSGDNYSFASAKAANAEKSGFQDPTIGSPFKPLVKPNAIGEASDKVKRKISVKRGVQL